MNRPEPDSPAAQARSRTAAEWFAKRDRGLTAAEQDEFLQWLAADPRHGEWFALHRRLGGDFTGLAQWRPEHSEEPNPDLLAKPRRRLRWLMPVGLAAAASLTVALVWWRVGTPVVETEATNASAYERRILADGSTVELNQGAVVTTAFTPGERRVTLVRGEALFTVAKNPARPFIVRAGGVAVRAVGTAFNVRIRETLVELTVTEGVVAVAQGGGHALERAAPRIAAGDGAVIRSGAVAPTVLNPDLLRQRTAWQDGVIELDGETLPQAVEEFNRYRDHPIIVGDPRLANLRVGGRFEVDEADKFITALEGSFAVSAIPTADGSILLVVRS